MSKDKIQSILTNSTYGCGFYKSDSFSYNIFIKFYYFFTKAYYPLLVVAWQEKKSHNSGTLVTYPQVLIETLYTYAVKLL